MRRLLTLTVLALALSAAGAATASPLFVIRGFGWGHGIGMAQYGAEGYARHGWMYDEILAHYYPGTTLGQAPTSRIRVLLASGQKALEIGSEAAFAVTHAGGRVELPAGTYRIGTGLELEVGGKLRKLEAPLRFQAGTKPLRLDRLYRGAIVVSLADGKLTAVNDLKLEQYLRGVVAGEMPADWQPEALKVQAVAARSYALASRKATGAFDVYADTRSQVYGGIAAEDPRTDAAIRATRAQVVLYDGKVAWTFFFASSGGRTAAIEDVWVGSEPVPYLVAVEDPYDTISPYHRWGPLTFTVEELSERLGSRIPDGLVDLRVNTNGSGRVASVTAIGTDGVTREISGWTVRALLDLRSTWFTIAKEGDLSSSRGRIVYGQKVTLSAVVSGRGEVTVEQRPAGGSWTVLKTVSPAEDGSVSLTIRPQLTTLYRLRVGADVCEAVRVAVAPRLLLDEPGERDALSGTIQPALAGAEVTIQRRSESWVAVASAVADENGRFRAVFDVTPGNYRARVGPLPGFVAGVSRPLSIGAA
jgi:stage II sporulation protein D